MATKMVAERLLGFNVHHLFGVHGIHHSNVIGKHRTLASNVTHAEAIQEKALGPSCIPAPISPISCIFQQYNFYSLARQRQCGLRATYSTPTIMEIVTLVIVILLLRIILYLVDFLARWQ